MAHELEASLDKIRRMDELLVERDKDMRKVIDQTIEAQLINTKNVSKMTK